MEHDKQAGAQLFMDATRKGAPGVPGTEQEFVMSEIRPQMADTLLWIRDNKGDEAVDAALAQIAALPDVRRVE